MSQVMRRMGPTFEIMTVILRMGRAENHIVLIPVEEEPASDVLLLEKAQTCAVYHTRHLSRFKLEKLVKAIEGSK